MRDYAKHYMSDAVSYPALEPYSSLINRTKNSNKTRFLLYSDSMIRRHNQCALLRNQMFAASILASHHMGRLWLFPLAWPFHVLTLWIWPSLETSRALHVQQMAKELEQAYQTGEAEWLQTCLRLMEAPVGKEFIRVQP